MFISNMFFQSNCPIPCVITHKPFILPVGIHIHGSRVTKNTPHNVGIDGIDVALSLTIKKRPNNLTHCGKGTTLTDLLGIVEGEGPKLHLDQDWTPLVIQLLQS